MSGTPDTPVRAAQQPVRVVLVDDQHLVRAGFRMLIDSQPDLTVVGEAADGAAAVQLVATTAADVILMDVRMPGMDGIEATGRITAASGSARVIVLTTFDLDEYVLSAIAAGASGFLLKDAPPEELLSAVRTVHVGDAVIAASATRRLLAHVGPMLRGAPSATSAASPTAAPMTVAAERAALAEAAAALQELTPREREVLVLIAHGLSNTEIADRLVLSETTVKTHVGRVLTKTGSRDRVQVVLLAYRCGVVDPADPLDEPA